MGETRGVEVRSGGGSGDTAEAEQEDSQHEECER